MALASAIALAVHMAMAAAGGPDVLRLPDVARWVMSQSYEERLAQARLREVQALQVGAAAPAPSNPELSLTAGPGFVTAKQPPATEFMITLAWPVDISGAFAWRRDWSVARAAEADAQLAEARRRAVFDACDLFVRAHGACDYLQLAQARAALDGELLRISDVRRAAGAVGDGDVALAKLLQAEGAALVQTADGERQALAVQLAQHLAWQGELPPLAPPVSSPVPSVDVLLQQARARPDVRQGELAQRSAATDRTLQDRLGWPVPRLSLAAGRGPEYQGELGLVVPLPVYQRNQTNAAVARARQDTADIERQRLEAGAAAEVRAAYATFLGADAAFAALTATAPFIDDAEHLALRAYELGQQAMSSVMVARRETMNARVALLEARIRRDRARLALDFATGRLPGLNEDLP